MGQGMSASATGAHAMFWNPASMSTSRQGPLFGFSHTEYAAGIDIDPTDGHIWAYERCASGQLTGGAVDCESNPVPPIFKFDRNTGEVLANFGADVFVTPGSQVEAGDLLVLIE